MLRYLGAPDIMRNTGVNFKKNISATVDALWQTREKSKDQFKPEFTTVENDKLYIQQFRKLWGKADDIYKWDIANMGDKNRAISYLKQVLKLNPENKTVKDKLTQLESEKGGEKKSPAPSSKK